VRHAQPDGRGTTVLLDVGVVLPTPVAAEWRLSGLLGAPLQHLCPQASRTAVAVPRTSGNHGGRAIITAAAPSAHEVASIPGARRGWLDVVVTSTAAEAAASTAAAAVFLLSPADNTTLATRTPTPAAARARCCPET